MSGHTCVAFLSLTERLHRLRRERGPAAGEGAVLVVRDKLWRADGRAGEDLKMLE